MQVLITDKAFAKGCGLLKDLESAITPEEVRRFERLGYIENAISPKGQTWKLSARGKELRKLLDDNKTVFDKITDFIFIHILRYRVSI